MVHGQLLRCSGKGESKGRKEGVNAIDPIILFLVLFLSLSLFPSVSTARDFSIRGSILVVIATLASLFRLTVFLPENSIFVKHTSDEESEDSVMTQQEEPREVHYHFSLSSLFPSSNIIRLVNFIM